MAYQEVPLKKDYLKEKVNFFLKWRRKWPIRSYEQKMSQIWVLGRLSLFGRRKAAPAKPQKPKPRGNAVGKDCACDSKKTLLR